MDFYRDGMFDQMEVEGAEYQLKPMNCPFHVLMYTEITSRSHRDHIEITSRSQADELPLPRPDVHRDHIEITSRSHRDHKPLGEVYMASRRGLHGLSARST